MFDEEIDCQVHDGHKYHEDQRGPGCPAHTAVAIASHIVPAGSYDRVYDAALDRDLVDPTSYHSVDRNSTTIFGLLMAIYGLFFQ
ncbi:hypothetical protein [Pseudoflavonifractor phocaeensis]|uniref:hypothetical protein n=1 Tax=Pseudoflavonifractor phocaeensis TaxID=1870988 RepID=UPI001F28D763|nr:hypothetical protein [Pseudoflavonifractor phocaeensis]MCF2662380.1 hypothetical protein [Pseudoflavonifractor phocaeensis]